MSSGEAAEDRIAALLSKSESVEIVQISRRRAERTLGLLIRVQAAAASKMCDVTQTVSRTDSASDPVEILSTKARMPPVSPSG